MLDEEGVVAVDDELEESDDEFELYNASFGLLFKLLNSFCVVKWLVARLRLVFTDGEELCFVVVVGWMNWNINELVDPIRSALPVKLLDDALLEIPFGFFK